MGEYLDEGRSIVLAVDSSEVWDGVSDDASVTDEGSDHAVVITEIDEASGIVTLNDPGQPEGKGFELSIDELEEAWGDSGNEMVVTDAASPTSTDPSSAQPSSGPADSLPTDGHPVTPTDPGESNYSTDFKSDPPGIWTASGVVILPVVLAGRELVGWLRKRQ